MNKFYKILIAIAVVVLIVEAFLLGRRSAQKSEVRVDVKREVVERVRIDTLLQLKPVYITQKVVDTLRILVPVTDTEVQPDADSCAVDIPIVERVYKDSTYRAVVTGYNPELKEIEIYRPTILRTETITNTLKPRFNFGVQLGIGPTYGFINRKLDVGVYAGIGFQYNF